MEPTIEEPDKTSREMLQRWDIHSDHYYRQVEPEIKTPLAVSVRDAAMLVVEKRSNATEWKNGQMPSGEVYDDFQRGGVSERINGLEINVAQRQDSSVSVEIFDSAMGLNLPNKLCEFTLLDTNSRGEAVAFLPEHSIYERMGVTKDEFVHLVTERLSGMANKIDLQSSIQQESTVATSSVQVALERPEANLLPQNPPPVTAKSEQIESLPANSVTWMESLKAQINNVDGSKLQVFAGNNKVYEQTDNVVTTDKLATPVGEKVQQALENPNELKGSVRIVVDGEKVYHAKNGQVLENKHSLTLENSPVAQEKSLNVAPEVRQVVQEQVLQGERAESPKPVVLDVSPVIEDKANTNNLGLDELSSSASFDSRSGRQIFSVPLNYNQPKLDERILKEADTVEVKTKYNCSLNEPQPHRPSRQIFSVPLNPTPVELDAKMLEVVTPTNASERGSVEQALASANARIDSLQAQLKDTQKSLEDLSKFVRNDNLKSWAEHKVTEVTKTSQSIAEQAKTKVMQWVHTKTVQVKLAIHDKVNEVKTTAQDKVNEVKTVAQDKVNEVKTAAQNKVNEVKTAAQLKGIEFKESVREQANKFLAPVNSAQVEQAAKHVVREYGDGKNYNKAATHSFHLNDKNELSIARQADGAVIYQKGELTKAASSHDILKLNALPNIVNQIKVTQMQTHQKQQMEVGS